MGSISKFSLGLSAVLLAGSAVGVAQMHQRQNPDANGDGNITRAEATAAAETHFARMDANGDGRLTSDDRAAGQQRRHAEAFARVDSDGNGAISRAEWDAHGTQMATHRAERREQRGQHGDNATRRLDRAAGAMAVMAHMADTNGDHAIDRTEFVVAATRRFERADTNHDGMISAAEHEAHRAQRRERRGRHRGGDHGGNMPPPDGE